MLRSPQEAISALEVATDEVLIHRKYFVTIWSQNICICSYVTLYRGTREDPNPRPNTTHTRPHLSLRPPIDPIFTLRGKINDLIDPLDLDTGDWPPYQSFIQSYEHHEEGLRLLFRPSVVLVGGSLGRHIHHGENLVTIWSLNFAGAGADFRDQDFVTIWSPNLIYG